MAVDPKTMKAEDFAKVSSIDFVYTFNKNMKQLTELLGITRKIEKVPGQTVKTYKVTGTLEDGTVAEGEEIPLSKYKTEVADIFELALKKYRKQTTYEAINDKGYEQAVEDTDSKMMFDIQAIIRNEFFTFLKTGTGAATPTGTGIQGALAAAWGKNQVYWEDYVFPAYAGMILARPCRRRRRRSVPRIRGDDPMAGNLSQDAAMCPPHTRG